MAQLGPYKPHRDGDTRRAMVIAIIRSVVELDGDEHFLKVKKKLLHTLIWAYTEADSKHNTRERSLAASRLVMPNTKLLKSALVHEHMTCKEDLVARLMRSSSMAVDEVMRDAVACLVTKEEHEHLTREDRKAKKLGKRRTAQERYANIELAV
jgi:RecA/RadA recombinase